MRKSLPNADKYKWRVLMHETMGRSSQKDSMRCDGPSGKAENTISILYGHFYKAIKSKTIIIIYDFCLFLFLSQEKINENEPKNANCISKDICTGGMDE